MKKRILLGFLLLVILVSSSFAVFGAGCCRGTIGCTTAFFESECSTLAEFDPQDCTKIPDCDIVACCHDLPDLSKSLYRSTCLDIDGPPYYEFIMPFTTNPASQSTYAEAICAGAAAPAQYVNCEQPNAPGKTCGSATTSETSPYCCARDSSVFPSFGACAQSPNCRVTGFFNISGTVKTPENLPVRAAQVKAGGKQVLTDDQGKYTIDFLADQSSGTAEAIKNNVKNHTDYTIQGANIEGIDIILNVKETPESVSENCETPGDQDGDQFGWTGTIADTCDSDCGTVTKTVIEAYYHPESQGERFTDAQGVSRDFCSDRLDNDCDGKADCEDEECEESPSCQKTICGDGIVQFPNSKGLFEQCDIGAEGDGDDSICPGQCVPPGEARECTCQYQAVCGNGIIDEPLEDCDGKYIPALQRWVDVSFSGDCQVKICGEPGSDTPCQCPEPGVCGDGRVDGPEQCEPNTDDPKNQCDDCRSDCTCPPKAAECGNNLLEIMDSGDPEHCDGIIDDDGKWSQFKSRRFGCTRDNCIKPDQKADIPPCTCPVDCRTNPQGSITLEDPSGEAYQRKITLRWTDQCQNDNALGYNIFRCETDNSEGTGCTKSNGKFIPLTSAPLGISNTYDDITIRGADAEEELYYCYYVQGLYGEMVANSPTSESGIKCIRAGREKCFTFRENYPTAQEFCSDNKRSQCTDDNQIEEIQDCSDVGGQDQFCVGPYSSTHTLYPDQTQCIQKSICDYCNDPLGLFGYSSATEKRWEESASPDWDDFGKAPLTRLQTLDRNSFISCIAHPFCYLDYSYTSVNQFFSFNEEGNTCYDFRSKKACEEFSRNNGDTCEWNWHSEYKELGIGVCRTKIIEEQQCDLCHDPHNKVFGSCDRETCQLYGNCYLDTPNLIEDDQVFTDAIAKGLIEERSDGLYLCRPEKEISCDNLDRKEDCINSAGIYSTNGIEQLNRNVTIDIDGYYQLRDFVRLSGTHEVTSPSDDYFGSGECEWVEPYTVTETLSTDDKITETEVKTNSLPSVCLKNSDDSPVFEDVLSYIPENRKVTLHKQLPDCGSIPQLLELNNDPSINDIIACRKDITDPVTSLEGINYAEDGDYKPSRIAGTFRIQALVNDESLNYSSAYPVTYACISGIGDSRSCYPNASAEYQSHSEGNLITPENIRKELSYDYFDEETGQSSFKSGLHVISIASEDISKNLEPVKNYIVYIDADKPDVSVTMSNRSYEIYNDVWLTNLTINMKILEGESATCDAELTRGEVPIYTENDIITELGNSWQKQYDALRDDTYTYHYRCEDEVGNIAEEWIEFIIEGDRSITNPLPKGTINKTRFEISVETGSNAECRYKYSIEDDSAFDPEKEFDPAIFNTMTKFSITGSQETPRTIHKSEVNMESGFHRYYIKCRMFQDARIVGNNADQIRFAVDVLPPATWHTTSSQSYNDWYNKDIDVSLACGDPAIIGQGLDWAYGCIGPDRIQNIYYCTGQDCWDLKKFQKYTKPIELEKTGYISYYSIDEGNNKEEISKDNLFQIDNETPELSIEFFDGERRAEVLVPGVLYKIRLNSTKPLISPAVASPYLSYISQSKTSNSTGKFTGTVELLPTIDPHVWEGLFRIELISRNLGFEGQGIFTAEAADYHNVTGKGTATIAIDTKPPSMPIIEPSMEDPLPEESEFQTLGYPIHYHNGTYYTNQETLFVTGKTDEYLDVIAVITADDTAHELIYTQSDTHMNYSDTLASAFQGRSDIKVMGDIRTRVNPEMYAGFKQEDTQIGPRREYGSYGMFYDITSMLGGDELFTELTIYPEIESTIYKDENIFFYDKETPGFWFGFNLPLKSFTNNTFYIKSYDESHNVVRYPSASREQPYLVLFSDPVAPQVISHFPREGSTSKTDMDIQVIFKEGKRESGLFEDSVEFKINGENVDFNIEPLDDLEEIDDSSNYYRIYHTATDLEDGDYYVEITAKDLAMNDLDQEFAESSWLFNVDTNIPADPEFSLLDGFMGPPGSDRWFVRQSPDFYIAFTDEPNKVILTNVYMESTPTEGDAAICEETDQNIFRCSFTEPKTSQGQSWADYGIIVEAYKILDDGTESDIGIYGPYRFTVDDQAPDFLPVFRTRFMDNTELLMGALVFNERHDLKATINIFDQEYTPFFTTNNGTFYYFLWDVPNYNRKLEGDAQMIFTLSDFAGNSRSVPVDVILDLTAPKVTDLGINISHTLDIGGELFTANPEVTVTGRFSDDDVDTAWIFPGEMNETTGIVEKRKYVELIDDEEGRPISFTVSVRLVDPEAGKMIQTPLRYKSMLINKINNMTLSVRDIAGHVSNTKLQVIRDIAAPLTPTFCVGQDIEKCSPI